MTNKEANEILRHYTDLGYGVVIEGEDTSKIKQALDLARKTLTNGIPIDDCISRSALLNQIDTTDWSDVRLLVEDAPTVPLPNEQIAWEQGYEAGLEQGKQDRPQSKWVYRQEWFEDEKEPRMAWGCNQCGFSIKSVHEKRNFCPYCGARMNDEDKSRIQEESNNMSWDKPSSKQEESEQSNNRTFDGICDLNDGIADPSYINDIIDCSDLGIYPWGNS